MSIMINRWREMFNDLMGSFKRVGQTAPIDNPIEDIVNKVEDMEKTANKYVVYMLIGLGLILTIKIVGVVD